VSPDDSIRVYDAEIIRNTITIADAIAPISEALAAFSAGHSLSPPLSFIGLENGGEIHIKSGYARGASHFVTKIAAMVPANRESGLPTSNGLMLVCSARTGYPVALLHDRKYLTDIRTAAVGAIAAERLAPQKVKAVGVLGSGGQAVLQIEALALVRKFACVNVWGRDRARAEAAAQLLRDRLPGASVSVRQTAEQVVRESTIIVTTTAATEPIVKGEWLVPGCHVTALGADDERKAELDIACLRRANFIACDSRTLGYRFGEVARARRMGSELAFDAELGELIGNAVAYTRADKDITISKHVGIGIEDLYIAQAFMARAS
jgi:ornithine cyclodeaminase/alanine dehydrogenase-like protein (mu-crystallin family)